MNLFVIDMKTKILYGGTYDIETETLSNTKVLLSANTSFRAIPSSINIPKSNSISHGCVKIKGRVQHQELFFESKEDAQTTFRHYFIEDSKRKIESNKRIIEIYSKILKSLDEESLKDEHPEIYIGK